MKKNILVCIGVVFVVLIVLFFEGAHGDGFAHPKIRVEKLQSKLPNVKVEKDEKEWSQHNK